MQKHRSWYRYLDLDLIVIAQESAVNVNKHGHTFIIKDK